MAASCIEWTEHTWNPIVGCSVVSPGCIHCYAMPMAARICAMSAALRPGHAAASHYAGTVTKVKGKPVWTGKVAMAGDDTLLAPLGRKKPTRYFVNSMGDLFHEAVPEEWIDRVFAVMALAPQHTFQVLTKRPERMREYVSRIASSRGDYLTWRMACADILSGLGRAHQATGPGPAWPLPNVWLGVSTEDQRRADERIPLLLATPAAVRFISAEPLLGSLDIAKYLRPGCPICPPWETPCRTGCTNCTRLDQVIVGGESGHNARPMHPDWPRAMRDQCADAGVPFFFKQWGAYGCLHMAREGEEGLIVSNGIDDSRNVPMVRIGKGRAGRLLDGVEHNGMPEVRA